MQKDKLVYSTDKELLQRERDKLRGVMDEEIRQIAMEEARIAMQRAVDAQDQRAFEKVLLDLGADPKSASFKARVAAFRRSCNLD